MERTEPDVVVRIAPTVVAVEVERTVIRAIVEVGPNHDRTATPLDRLFQRIPHLYVV